MNVVTGSSPAMAWMRFAPTHAALSAVTVLKDSSAEMVCVRGSSCLVSVSTNTHTNTCSLLTSTFPPAGGEENGLFGDIQDDEVEVLQQMLFGVVLCALATLAAKGDLVYTSVFMGAMGAMAGYWLSNRGERLLQGFIKTQ